MMNVYVNKAKGKYCGGIAIIAANNEQEAAEVFHKSGKVSEWDIWLDEYGDKCHFKDEEYNIQDNEIFPNKSWKLSTKLESNVTEPKLLYCEYHAE